MSSKNSESCGYNMSDSQNTREALKTHGYVQNPGCITPEKLCSAHAPINHPQENMFLLLRINTCGTTESKWLRVGG